MTPAEELRTAAKLMRERVQGATAGPWTVREEHGRVAPWQERAEQRHFPLLAEFQQHMRGELLADRGLDVSAWPQQRAAANGGDVSATPGRECPS